MTRARTAFCQVMLFAPSLLALAISSNIGQGHLLSVARADAWRSMVPTGTAPSPRRQEGLILDQRNDRVVVAGGENSDGKTWTLNLAGSPVWTLLDASAPSDANGAVRAIYDAEDQQMILVTPNLNVYSLDLDNPTVWTTITPVVAGPAPRSYPAVAYDSLRDRLILFGGGPYTGLFSDVWALNLSGGALTWQQLSPQGPGPSPRWGSTAIYDQAQDRLVIATGNDAAGVRNDVWALSLGSPNAWTQIAPQGALPVPRFLSAADYDPVTGSLVLFGGNVGTCCSGLNDTWELDLSNSSQWTPHQPTGSLPPPRWSHMVAYRHTVPELVTFGGWDGGSYRTDIWALSRPDSGGAPIIYSFSPAAGRNGDQVQIFGFRLNAPSQVTIGGAVAWVLSSSKTSITAVVPPSAVTGPISVTTSLGTATTTSNYVVEAGCPNTSYSLMGGEPRLDPAPTGSAGGGDRCGSGVQVSWNALAGSMAVSADGPGYDCGAIGFVTISDDFKIIGPPPGTIVSLTVRFVAGGNYSYGFSSSNFYPSMSDAQGHSGTLIEATDHRRVIELPLRLAAGTSVPLSFTLGGEAASTSENAGATYSFPDLPAGTSIRSCRGFRAAGPPKLSCPQALTMECSGALSAAADPRIRAWLASASAEGGCNDHLAVTNDAPANFDLGEHPITFVARDSCGNQSQCVSTLTVVDRTPPKLAVAARPGRLWPPNHAMWPVMASIEVSDLCDPTPRVSLEGVDIQDMGAGRNPLHDGPDVQGAEAGVLDTLVGLRAERAGGGPRRYVLRYRASDHSGNSVIGTAEVVVDGPGRGIALGDSVDSSERRDQPPAVTEWSQDGTLILATPEFVDCSVYGVDGRRLRQVLLGQRPAGRRPLAWDTRDEAGRLVPSGVYYVRVVAGGYRCTRSIVVVR